MSRMVPYTNKEEYLENYNARLYFLSLLRLDAKNEAFPPDRRERAKGGIVELEQEVDYMLDTLLRNGVTLDEIRASQRIAHSA